MRDNLIFYGIPETDEENCEDKVKIFVQEKLEIHQNVEFHRVHRMGRKVPNKVRPIVAKFVLFKEKEMVRKAAYKLAGDENKQFGISEQFPREINEKRKKLYPYYKAAKQQERKAQLIFDKLIIDGELFTPDESDEEEENGNNLNLPLGRHTDPRLSAAAAEFTPRPRGGGRGGSRRRPGRRR
ncbi:uncharacterized protein LOC134230565 [Saccostrea cucullata]|uniref:uncharacterized protein LOC134230565 n=1 Tax=Saccostrea cuccullata TaxID=36930 RepID=UPI002ED5BD8D